MVVLWDLMAGWWWLEYEWIMIFLIYWEFHNPNWLSLHHFSEGWLKTTKQQLWCWPQLHPQNKHPMDLSWCFLVLDMTMGPWWVPYLSKLRSLRIREKKNTGFSYEKTQWRMDILGRFKGVFQFKKLHETFHMLDFCYDKPGPIFTTAQQTKHDKTSCDIPAISWYYVPMVNQLTEIGKWDMRMGIE